MSSLVRYILALHRSSRPELFRKKGVLKNSQENTATGAKLWHRCFPVNFVKFLRTLTSIEHLW